MLFCMAPGAAVGVQRARFFSRFLGGCSRGLVPCPDHCLRLDMEIGACQKRKSCRARRGGADFVEQPTAGCGAAFPGIVVRQAHHKRYQARKAGLCFQMRQLDSWTRAARLMARICARTLGLSAASWFGKLTTRGNVAGLVWGGSSFVVIRLLGVERLGGDGQPGGDGPPRRARGGGG